MRLNLQLMTTTRKYLLNAFAYPTHSLSFFSLVLSLRGRLSTGQAIFFNEDPSLALLCVCVCSCTPCFFRLFCTNLPHSGFCCCLNSNEHKAARFLMMSKSVWLCVALLLAAAVCSAVPFRRAMHGDEEMRSNVGNCPDRPDVPRYSRPLPSTVMKQIIENVQKTLAPCTAGAHNPSSTSISGGIVYDGITSFFNLGCVDVKTPNVAPTENTIYRIGSVTKVLAVESVLVALRDQRLASLDDEIRKYMPDFYVDTPYGSAQPTFRQVASQLASLPRSAPCDDTCPYNTSTMMNLIKRYVRLLTPLNTMPSYSNLGYAVLGAAVGEHIYKSDFFSFIKARFTDRLGMWSTGINFTTQVKQRMATEYLPDGSVASLIDLGWVSPSGGMYTSSLDMSAWLKFYLAEWQSDPLRRETMQPIYVNGDKETGWGMPWEIMTSNGFMVRTKGGALPGVRAIIGLVPELNFGFWTFWNGQGMYPGDTAQAIADIVIPELVKQHIQQQSQNWPNLTVGFAEYTGIYSAEGYNLTISIESSGNQSVAKLTFPEGNLNHYLRPYPPNPYQYQLFAHRHLQPCMRSQFDANINEWLYFSKSDKGVPQVMCPGLFFALFTKVA